MKLLNVGSLNQMAFGFPAKNLQASWNQLASQFTAAPLQYVHHPSSVKVLSKVTSSWYADMQIGEEESSEGGTAGQPMNLTSPTSGRVQTACFNIGEYTLISDEVYIPLDNCHTTKFPSQNQLSEVLTGLVGNTLVSEYQPRCEWLAFAYSQVSLVDMVLKLNLADKSSRSLALRSAYVIFPLPWMYSRMSWTI